MVTALHNDSCKSHYIFYLSSKHPNIGTKQSWAESESISTRKQGWQSKPAEDLSSNTSLWWQGILNMQAKNCNTDTEQVEGKKNIFRAEKPRHLWWCGKRLCSLLIYPCRPCVVWPCGGKITSWAAAPPLKLRPKPTMNICADSLACLVSSRKL